MRSRRPSSTEERPGVYDDQAHAPVYANPVSDKQVSDNKVRYDDQDLDLRDVDAAEKRGRWQGFCFRRTRSGRILPYICWKG